MLCWYWACERSFVALPCAIGTLDVGWPPSPKSKRWYHYFPHSRIQLCDHFYATIMILNFHWRITRFFSPQFASATTRTVLCEILILRNTTSLPTCDLYNRLRRRAKNSYTIHPPSKLFLLHLSPRRSPHSRALKRKTVHKVWKKFFPVFRDNSLETSNLELNFRISVQNTGTPCP